jgi:hypothetical protein
MVPFGAGSHHRLKIISVIKVSAAAVYKREPVMHHCHLLPHLGPGRPGIACWRPSLKNQAAIQGRVIVMQAKIDQSVSNFITESNTVLQ